MARWASGSLAPKLVATIIVVASLGLGAARVRAYPLYRNTASPGTNDCFQCHGSFSLLDATPYQRCVGGANNGPRCTNDSECPGGTCVSWGSSLHVFHHNGMLGAPMNADANRCDACHLGSNKTPVVLNESNGTTGFDAIGCIGCHGRQADRGTRPDDCVDAMASNGPCGDGAGLRQHHERSGVTNCGGCHGDSLPATFTPVSEAVAPPFYFTPDLLHPLKPTDPCSGDDFGGPPDGLDDDGDLLENAADPDCPTPTPTPTVTVTATPTPVATPNKDSSKCQAAIVKNAAAFVQARTKALQKCEDGVVKRKITAPCPDQKANDSIAKAQSKLGSGIAKACGGKDKTCGSGGDDVPLGVIDWSGPCPDFESKGCTTAIDECSDITTCVSCIGNAAVDQAIGLYYDGYALQPTDPKSKDKREKALNKCQAAIGKAGATFVSAQSKALQKCWDGKNKGSINDCPDLKAGDSISKAAVKLASAINGACGGKDKQPGGAGDDADFSPTDIGFPASCMDVNFPGFITPCTGAVTDLQSLVGCVACVSRFKAGCADRAGAFGLGPYPAECNP